MASFMAITVPLSAAPSTANAAVGLKAGDRIRTVLDLVTYADNTQFFGAVAPADDLIVQTGNPAFNNYNLVLVDRDD